LGGFISKINNMKKKTKRESLVDDLFVRMLELAGKPPSAADDFYYRFNNTLTREQFSQFKKEGIFMIQKADKINKTKAISAFNWFWKQYGLRLKG